MNDCGMGKGVEKAIGQGADVAPESDDIIAIVPAIRSLTLNNIGPWPSLQMEFHHGLNVITGGLGKTTILKAMLKGVSPSHDDGRLTPREDSEEGRIGIEFAPRRVVLRRKRGGKLRSKLDSRGSHGQRMLRLLRDHIGMAGAGDALLFDEEVLKALDPPGISKAVRMLKASPAQTICVVPRWMELGGLAGARVFSCVWDREENLPKMKVGQSGKI